MTKVESASDAEATAAKQESKEQTANGKWSRVHKRRKGLNGRDFRRTSSFADRRTEAPRISRIPPLTAKIRIWRFIVRAGARHRPESRMKVILFVSERV